jgi:1-deoxy-D-xylulose-5-phosphate reductoisomerase
LNEAAKAAGLREKFGARMKIFTEKDTLREFTSYLDADILLAATSGTTSLLAVIDALERGRKVALSNKEILVMAGASVMESLAKNPSAVLVPVDSKHSAIFQCMRGNSARHVRRLILTSSGGPLREVSKERFRGISKEEVINHPKWKMGQKISVDSATMMNKGLEIIEASWLFGVPIDKIDVWIHPEAIVHSMVEFEDGAMLAQLGVTDMRLPIQVALAHPEGFRHILYLATRHCRKWRVLCRKTRKACCVLPESASANLRISEKFFLMRSENTSTRAVCSCFQ